MNFVNRNEELNFLINSIKEKHQIIYFNYNKASGISAFLKKCEAVFADKHVFLLDANENPDFAKSFCDKACKNLDLRNIMQNIANNKFGEKSQTFLSALLKSSPYMGELLSYIIEKPSIPFIYTGSFSSVYEEITISMIDELRKIKKVIFIIDNAIFLSESSRRLCGKLSNKLNVYFIFALEKNCLETKKLKNLFNDYTKLLNVKPVNYDFCHPDTKMIQMLSEIYQIPCSKEQAEDIAIITHDNIHLIIDYLLNYNDNIQLNQIQKIIINILNEVSYRIPLSLLINIVEHLDNAVLLDVKIIEVEVKRFIDLRIIEKREELLYLISKNHPKVVESLEDWLLTESVKSAILETFCENKIYKLNEYYLKVSYEIALHFHDNRYLVFSKMLLKNAVSTGASIKEDIFDICKNNSINEDDNLIVALYLIQSRRYSEALEVVEKSINTMYIKPLYAVLLNRCRHHERAEKELKLAINNEKSTDKVMILYSYLISNYVHSNNSQKAKQLFNSIPMSLRHSPEFAYVLRNIATVYLPEKAANLSNEAAKIFEKNHDSFGKFTAKCNEYRFLCAQGYYKKALDKMMSILDTTVNYRNSDLHILLNNIAICHIYLKNIDEAKYYIKSALCISNATMPDIFLRINYSLLLLLNGNASKALEMMEKIKNLVLIYPVDRVRQRYFINYCHILYANDMNYDEALEKAKEFKDRIQPHTTEELCKFYENAIIGKRMYKKEDFFTLFIPCYLEYWYTEPLKLISPDIINNILPFHTGSDDITNQILI